MAIQVLLDKLVDKFASEGIREGYYLRQLAREIEHPTFSDSSRNFGALELIAIGGATIAIGIPGCSPAAIMQSISDPAYGPPIFFGPQTGLRDFKGHHDGKKGTFLGNDYTVPIGTNVVAVADGSILAVQNRSLGGISIWQEHGNGYVSVYMHLSEVLVRDGHLVKRGETIAKSGMTGITTYPLLHYGFGRLFSGEGKGLAKFTLWMDPDELGGEGGRLKLYRGLPTTDKTPLENRVYYRDILQSALAELKDEHKGKKVPDGLQSYLDYIQDSNSEHAPIWRPLMVYDMLNKYRDYFKEGAIMRYGKKLQQMLDPKLPVPAVLTHPIQNPVLEKPKTLYSR